MIKCGFIILVINSGINIEGIKSSRAKQFLIMLRVNKTDSTCACDVLLQDLSK